MFICQRAVTGSHLPVYLCCLIIYSSKITFQYIIWLAVLVITDLLTSTIKSHPYVVLESMSRLREAFDYLMLLPLSTADGLLRSIQPLLKLSPTLRDALVIVLRKAIFSRYIPVGFLCSASCSHSVSLLLQLLVVGFCLTGLRLQSCYRLNCSPKRDLWILLEAFLLRL